MNALTIQVPDSAKTRFVVINDCMLGYIQPGMNLSAGILASSVIRGAHHFWQDGPYPLRHDGKDQRPATVKDFEDFRVGVEQYQRCPYHAAPTA
jgi:hypothetical protein